MNRAKLIAKLKQRQNQSDDKAEVGETNSCQVQPDVIVHNVSKTDEGKTPGIETNNDQSKDQSSPLAKLITNVKENCEFDWDSWDPMGDDLKSAANNLTLDPSKDPMCQITGERRIVEGKVGQVTVCEHFSRYGECADGDYCDRVHLPPYHREKLWALQRQSELNKNRLCTSYLHLSPSGLLHDPEKLVLVSVTNNQLVNDFHMIVPYENHDFSRFELDDIKFYIDNVKSKSNVKTKLRKIHLDLKSLFDHKYRVDNLKDRIYLSQIVACKTQDGHFRRAMVTRAPLSTEIPLYRLLLIDLGIELQLPREDIYDIKAECLSEPPLAINARLPIKPKEDKIQFSDDLMIYFEMWTEKSQFCLSKIISYNDMDRIFTVDLIDCSTRKSLVGDIIQRGLAKLNY